MNNKKEKIKPGHGIRNQLVTKAGDELKRTQFTNPWLETAAEKFYQNSYIINDIANINNASIHNKSVDLRELPSEYYEPSYVTSSYEEDYGFTEEPNQEPDNIPINIFTQNLNDFKFDINSTCIYLLCCYTKTSVDFITAATLERDEQNSTEYLITYHNGKYEVISSKNLCKKYIGVETVAINKDCFTTLFFDMTTEGGNVPYIRGNSHNIGNSIGFFSDSSRTFRRTVKSSTQLSKGDRVPKKEVVELVINYDVSKDCPLSPGNQIIFIKYGRELEGTLLETDMPGTFGVSKVLSILGDILIVDNKDIKNV